MIRDILIYPHPTLSTPAKAVVEVDESIRELCDDLIDTCEQIGGVGLAAPQIGVNFRVFVVNVGGLRGGRTSYELFINPVVVESEGSCKVSEGCLSLPGIRSKVERFEQFGIEYTTLEGTRETMSSDGILGQALQHELDHLEGTVLIDRMSRIKRPGAKQKMKILKRRMKAANLSYHDVIRTPEA